MECVTKEIEKHNFEVDKTIIVSVIYRPPNTDTDVFINTLNTFIGKNKPENKYCFLLGDYNTNISNYATHSATADFVGSLPSYGFLPLISRSTRVTTRSATLIDNLFTNNFQQNIASCQGTLVTDVSDHFPIFHMSRFQAAFQCTETSINARNFSYPNKQAFQNALDETDWSEIYSDWSEIYSQPRVLFYWFYSRSKNLYNKHFPVQKVKLCYNNRKPWQTDALKNRSEQKINYVWNIWK